MQPVPPSGSVDLGNAQLVPDTVDPATVREPLPGDVFESLDGERPCLVLRSTTRKGVVTDVPITDCSVRVICSTLVDENYSFEVALKRGREPEQAATLSADDLVRPQSINAWAAKKARSFWNMDQDQLAAFRRYIMQHPGAKKVVHSLTTAGYVPKYGVTVGTPNAIDVDGLICKPNGDGVFTLKCLGAGEKRMFRSPPPDRIHVPAIEHDLRMELEPARAIMRQFHEQLRTYYLDNRGSIAFGWLIAHIFRDALFPVRNCFPHTYIHGKAGVGKNELATWMMRATGTPYQDFPNQESYLQNPKGIRNAMNDTCNFPLWIDELRNEPGATQLLSFIRTTYNGSGSQQARMEGGSKAISVRRSLILTGQHVVGQEAEMRRYVLIPLERDKGCPAREVEERMNRVQHAILTFIAMRHVLAPIIRRYAEMYGDILQRAGVDFLYAWPWGVALAGLRISGWPDEPQANPLKSLPENAAAEAVILAKAAISTAATEGTIGQLWRVIESLDASGKLHAKGKETWCRAFEIGDTRPTFARGMDSSGKIRDDVARNRKGELLERGGTYLAIWLSHLHDAYSQASVSRRTNGFPLEALITEFRGTEGFVSGPHKIRLDFSEANVPKRPCFLFHFDEQRGKCIPDWVREQAFSRGVVGASEAE